MKTYWKDNLGVELEVRERNDRLSERRLGFVSGVDLELYRKFWSPAQLHHMTVESWSPDPSQIVSSLPTLNFFYNIVYPNPNPIPSGYPVLLALFHYATSLPLDHPDRCKAFQEYESAYLDRCLHHPYQGSRPSQVGRPALARRLPEHLQPGLQHPHVPLRRQALGTPTQVAGNSTSVLRWPRETDPGRSRSYLQHGPGSDVGECRAGVHFAPQ